MKLQVSVEIAPFEIPKYVYSKGGHHGIGSHISYPLDLVDRETLEKLCIKFVVGVFKEAGKPPPPYTDFGFLRLWERAGDIPSESEAQADD